MKKVLMLLAVVLGTVTLTALAIDASDTLTGNQGTLLARVLPQTTEVCPKGMTEFKGALTFTCVDVYEAAVGAGCSIASPLNQFQTEANIAQEDCEPVSLSTALPWSFVGREQAKALCTKAGKRLPTANEWYEFALGTPSSVCVIDGDGAVVGDKQSDCISAGGVVGAVGNVWEWVKDDVIDGKLNSYILPKTGYVVSVNSDGVAHETSVKKGEADLGYFWSESVGLYGVIRGGFYGSKRDSSVYTMHTHTSPQFVGAAVGFRCVR
jgi:Sulfatase-modifying factor enzyme 1